jgi:hypothetical protein
MGSRVYGGAGSQSERSVKAGFNQNTSSFLGNDSIED